MQVSTEGKANFTSRLFQVEDECGWRIPVPANVTQASWHLCPDPHSVQVPGLICLQRQYQVDIM